MKAPGKKRLTGYNHPIRVYAPLYGLPSGTVANAYRRKWPLDDPSKLLELMEKAPGPKSDLTTLRKIVNGDVEQLASSPSLFEPDGKLKPSTAGVIEDTIQFSMAIAGGLMSELERLKKETFKSYQLYVAELRPADKILRNKIWLANVAALRQMAKEAPKAERDAGNVLAVSDVESTWSRAFKECKTALESLGRRVSTSVLFAALDPIDVEQVINKEVVTVLSHLESGGSLRKKTDDAS